MVKTGNLFEQAERLLQYESEIGKRSNYNTRDVIDYAILIRKWLDRHTGSVYGITRGLYGKKAWRRQVYLKTGR